MMPYRSVGCKNATQLAPVRSFRLIAGLAATFACSSIAHAQILGQGQDQGVSATHIVISLFFCLILAVVAAFVMRRRMTAGLFAGWQNLIERVVARESRPKRLQIIETARLGPHLICILRCDGAEWLVTATQQNVSMLTPLSSRSSQGAEEKA
jgi:flagellar biogenesis protein FliO